MNDSALSTQHSAPAPSERLVALDVFRGLTIAAMLLVNDPGSWSAIYPPLEHAPWHGWTPTDLIFPFFLFIVGITTHLSLSKRDPASVRGKIIRRGLLIVLVGLLLNAFPFFWWGKIAGNPDPAFWQRVVYRAQHLRFLGVLAGRWITQRQRPLVERIAGLYGAGCLGMLAGLFWSWVFPINKNLWTSSYVVFTAGFACVV